MVANPLGQIGEPDRVPIDPKGDAPDPDNTDCAPATGNASGTEIKSTEGVVTAAYPVGGFNGLYIQTPGADTV